MLEDRGVARQRGLVGVREVGQQSEVEHVVAVGEEPHLERLDHVVDVFRATEHGRHHHEAASRRGHAVRIVHAGQAIGGGGKRRDEIQQAEGELARHDQRSHRQQHLGP